MRLYRLSRRARADIHEIWGRTIGVGLIRLFGSLFIRRRWEHAGARLITTRCCGNRKPELTIARSTRCVLSRTAASGSPTSTVLGSPAGETSTSTSTGKASIPKSEKVCNRSRL